VATILKIPEACQVLNYFGYLRIKLNTEKRKISIHVVFSLEEKNNTGVIQIREEVGHVSQNMECP
jgi:hypothetical protein